MYIGYDTTYFAPTKSDVAVAHYTIIESPWMVCADGISKTAVEVNRETGEYRTLNYAQALADMFP